MVDNTSTHVRKSSGVRFNENTADSLNNHEENPSKTIVLDWQQYLENNRSFDLYFGILKLSHIYTMKFDVSLPEHPIKLETIFDHDNRDNLQILVNDISHKNLKNRASYEVQIIINAKTIPGPFQRTVLLREISKSQEKSVQINVTGKILREGQGTATLRQGVHMKLIKQKDDDE